MAGAFAAWRHSKHDGKHCQSSKDSFVLVLLAAAKRSEDGSSKSCKNPNADDRNPKEIRSPKPEPATPCIEASTVRSKTFSFVAADVSRRKFSVKIEGRSAPTNVGGYFFNGLLTFGFRASDFFRTSEFGFRTSPSPTIGTTPPPDGFTHPKTATAKK